MSGLSTQQQMSRDGRTLISQLMAGTAEQQLTDFSIPAPGSSAVANVGAAGSSTWAYVIKSVTAYGQGLPFSIATTATGNAGLGSANYNSISWSAVAGALSYNVYRTVSGNPTYDLGLIGNTTSLTLFDMGQAPIKDTAGISHVAVGSGVGGAYSSFGTNPRLGNNLEMTGIDPIILHNDFPVYNSGPNGFPNTFYFIEVANTSHDLALSFGNSATGSNCLQQDCFNHLFLIDTGTMSGAYGIGEVQNVPLPTATPPTPPNGTIVYIGYVECDIGAKTFFNPTRMFHELGRVAPSQVSFLGDRAINGPVALELLQPNLLDVSLQPNPNLLVRAQFNLGITDTIREIAVIGNAGQDIIAWGVPTFTNITTGQGVFIRWAIAF
jgi:hypothetical protein